MPRPAIVSTGLALTLAALGCQAPGSGQIAEETRGLSPFTRLEIDGVFSHVAVEHCDDCAPQVILRGDDNLLHLVETDVSGDTLSLYAAHRLAPSEPFEARVMAPTTTEIAVSGLVTVSVWSVGVESLDADVEEYARIRLVGALDSFTARAASGGQVQAYELRARSAAVLAVDDGQIEVCATDILTADARSADVYFDCDPEQIDAEAEDGGRVQARPSR